MAPRRPCCRDTLPAIQTEFNVTDAQLGGFSSLLSATQALGALFWGSLADAVGRRPAFLGSVGLTALCGVCSAWAVSSGLPAYLSLRALDWLCHWRQPTARRDSHV